MKDGENMKELEYPFDSQYLLKKRKSLKKELLSQIADTKLLTKNIAILGGSTTHDIKDILELFLLHTDINPIFYESEYSQYWQDVMFDNQELITFKPDIVFIHTSTRNIQHFPAIQDNAATVESLIEKEYLHFEQMWNKIEEIFHCPIIQNNFEQPFYRLLGNMEFTDIHGQINFINRLNTKFCQYAQEHRDFYINDINYMASCYGLQKWADPFYWHMYKYAMCVPAIPEFSYNVANIIKAIYGKNKKALVLDLDNTLWGGVIGDDGVDNIEIGQETSLGQVYSEFQTYIKKHKDLGVLLAVNSKNDEFNAVAGLNRPDSILKPEDFVDIKANWENKDRNIIDIVSKLNIGMDSLVFVDDNPAERHIVKSQIPEVAVPELGDAVQYIIILDRSGFFESTGFSEDDLKRSSMYRANLERQKQEEKYADYSKYLQSLAMNAEIKSFAPMYMSRIAQLTNKSNQFNLTTKRCTQSEIEKISKDPSYITLYGKLGDKFGDNGVVSVIYGHRDSSSAENFHIDLWLMSCRVLKRDMELAMLDELVEKCYRKGIYRIIGYYDPTIKNGMVREFYDRMGFRKINEDEEGNTIWEYVIPENYERKNKVILVNGSK